MMRVCDVQGWSGETFSMEKMKKPLGNSQLYAILCHEFWSTNYLIGYNYHGQLFHGPNLSRT